LPENLSNNASARVRGCTRKRRYATEALAKRAALLYAMRDNDPSIHGYACQYCEWWHIGHSKVKRSLEDFVNDEDLTFDPFRARKTKDKSIREVPVNQVSEGVADAPMKVPQEDYVRMERAISIYGETRQLLAGIKRSEFENDRTLTLAVSRLVDLLATNLSKVTARGRVAGVNWHGVVGIKSHLTKVRSEPNYDVLWRLLTELLPRIMDSVEAAYARSEPFTKPAQPSDSGVLYGNVRGKSEFTGGFRSVFKTALGKVIRAGHPLVETALCRMCNLDDLAQEAARVKTELLFQALPEKFRKDLHGRLRSPDDVSHIAAVYELYFHELFLRRGWKVDPHTLVAGSRPDYFVSKAESAFYLEVLSAWETIDLQTTKGVLGALFTVIDEELPDMLVRVELLEIPKTTAKDALAEALRSAMASAVETQSGLDLHLAAGGVNAILHMRPRYGISSNCSVYEWFISDRVTDEEDLLIDRILRKNIKAMAQSDYPLVLAGCTRDNVKLDRLRLLQRLFGDVTVTSTRDGLERVDLHHQGRALAPHVNTRISAIIFCIRRWDRNQLGFDIDVVHNPWAQRPLPEAALAGFRQLVPEDVSGAQVRMRYVLR
jgi:hypothetical protein